MKKIVFGLIALSLGVIYSCDSNESISNEDIKLNGGNASRSVNDEIIICGPPGELGEAGPGYWGPNSIAYNNCNKPGGPCVYAESFGGGGSPLGPKWRVKLLNEDFVRFEFLSPSNYDINQLITQLNNEQLSGDAWVKDKDGNRTGETFDAALVAEFMLSHYQIPNSIPFIEDLNSRLVAQDQQIFAQKGIYDIIIDSEHPFGYFDMSIVIRER